MKGRVYTELFNKERKEKFLNERYSNKATANSYKLLFLKSYELENYYNTDLSDFTHEQLKELWDVLNCSTFESIYKYKTVARKYMEWSISNGIRKSALDLTGLFNKADIISKINKVAIQNQYISSRDELYEICSQLYNKRDAAIVVLLYEGIKLEYIQNLKTEDCDFTNNIIKVVNKKGISRILGIDKKSMDILYEASIEPKYCQSNGKPTKYLVERKYTNTPYLIKIAERKNGYELLTLTTLNSILTKIAVWVERPFLNPKNITWSGILEQCKYYEEKYKELTPSHYRKICDKYFIDPKRWFAVKDFYIAYKSAK
jgi:site-specific recombinase XerD